MKVLHLPTDVGGHAWGLAQGERRLGLEPTVLTKVKSTFNYPFDVCLEWDSKSRREILLDSIRKFFRYRGKFDVFHFNYGSSLIDFRGNWNMYHWDLPFYPGKTKLVFTYNGCDARQKYKTMARVAFSSCHEERCYNGYCMSGEPDKQRAKSISIVSKHADHIFALNPDLLYFLPEHISSFLPYAVARWYDIEPVPYKPGRKLKIIHAPTDRFAKGSHYIVSALENLKRRFDFEFIMVENMTNEAALKAYRTADVVIDQTLTGWYGGFAVEAMKMGKPVAVYIREEDLRFIPSAMAGDLKKAVIGITPSTIETVIERCIQEPSILIEKHEASLDYVHKWHDPVYVASLTKAVYEG